MITVTCEFCGKSFKTYPKRRAKYCSHHCYWDAKDGSTISEEHREAISQGLTGRKLTEAHKAKIAERSGPNHWRWNDDREDQKARNRASKIYYTLINRTLGHKKLNRTVDELGYSSSELKNHLQSLFKEGMSWKNHGKGPGKWHVDHVRPISDFPLGTPPSAVNALSNLQPLWEEDNLSKGGKKVSKR